MCCCIWFTCICWGVLYLGSSGISSVQFSHSGVSDTLWHHGLRHSRPHQGYWSAIFVACNTLMWLYHEGDACFVKSVWNCSLLFSSFWRSLRRIGTNSSLNVWLNSLKKPSGPGLFSVGGFFITAWSPTSNWPVLTFYFIMIQSW